MNQVLKFIQHNQVIKEKLINTSTGTGTGISLD